MPKKNRMTAPRDEPQEGETTSPRTLAPETDFRTGLPEPPEEERDPWDAIDSGPARIEADDLNADPLPDSEDADYLTDITDRPPELPDGVEEPYYEEEYPGETGVADGTPMVEEARLVDDGRSPREVTRRRRDRRRPPQGTDKPSEGAQDDSADEHLHGDRHLGRHHKPGHGRGR